MKSYVKSLWDGGKRRKLEGTQDKLVGAIAVIMSLYQLWYAVAGTIQPLLHYCIHLTFVLALCYLTYTPRMGANRGRFPMIDAVLAFVIAAAGIYYMLHVSEYVVRWPMVDPLPTVAILVAVIFIVLIIDGTRRTMGMVLPLIGVIFVLYCLFGHLLTGGLYHRYINVVDVIDQLMFTTSGVFTSPVACSSTFVFLFCLFGSFFSVSGAGDFFYRFSMAAAGRYTGGAGKVSVLASCLFGMINGSPTANVATTGSFTIPMMERDGYDKEFAGAVCAVASTGGGIMPPIMGTAAFLMVEMAGIPYRDIAIAGAIPGVIFYLALLIMVHFRAKKLGLVGMEKKDLPPMLPTLKEGFPFIVPLGVLIYMILAGYTASMSAVGGIVSVVIVSWFRKETRMTLKKILLALKQGALSAVIVTLSCAVAGMVINGLTSTGLGGKAASLILSLGGNSLILALLLTAIICTILGMGMPVAAAYALTASLAVPSLIALGISTMSAHMFAVYYATLSAITPPVAVASYAAAGIADASASKIGWKACKLGLVAFLVPFMFALEPRLLTVFTDFTPYSLWCMLTALLGALALSSALEGWLLTRINALFRILMLIAGLLMMYPEPVSDFVGIAMIGVIALLQIRERAKEKHNGGKTAEATAA